MRALKFVLKGDFAAFRKHEVNTVYFTYGNIHKVALLGIFGSILGYGGYQKQSRSKKSFPEFYEKLKDLKISVEPLSKRGSFSKKLQKFNNSTGYASSEDGGNLIVEEQLLESPKWMVYLLLNSPQAEEIADRILSERYIYLPYLGKNDHFADIKEEEVVFCKREENPKQIDSLFFKKAFSSEEDLFNPDKLYFQMREYLPVALDERFNQYQLEEMVFTNFNITSDAKEEEVYLVEGKNIFFY